MSGSSNAPIINRRDLDFILFEFLDLEERCTAPRFSAFDRSAIDAFLDSAEKIAEEKYLPCAALLDENEPRFENGKAVTPPELKTALTAFAEAGFFAAGFDEEIGGLQAPATVQAAVNAMFASANVSIHNYASLTVSAANLIDRYGSQEQREKYLPPMLEGRWFGVMDLSEPHAGSSLTDIRTRAESIEGNTYSITGTKMWISGGEHDVSENIVHMVLAKIPGGPPGVKGISLFIVPKFRDATDGTFGERNNIVLAGLNHKMGNRGTTNTLLNFGEDGPCHGYLVGEPHRGLEYMFMMMNEARITVGHGAAMMGLAGFLYSLNYAQERHQGRAANNKDPQSPQIPIVQHADVKRMLMAQKVFSEGGMALVLYAADIVDRLRIEQDENDRVRLGLLLDLLTPIVKSWPSEFCLEANKHAIQVLGGYGYTRDYPVERLYRDNRLNMIHEGAHGIHGLDILGRKVRIADGAAMDVFQNEIAETISSAKAKEELSEEASILEQALEKLALATERSIKCENRDRALANATLYLEAFGHIVVGWIWLRQALIATSADPLGPDAYFYAGKKRAARYFFRYEMPKAMHDLQLVAELDETCLDASPEEFIGS